MANARLVQVGGKAGVARREIDAAGALVTPGFVDIHTHFDGQLTWDPYLTPSNGHGVTTIVAGNCGVGFAPAKPDKHAWLIDLMEGVEDIPWSALAEGIQWEWESFPECLDVIARRRYAMNIGTQVPHGPLRAYVMGERGTANEEATTDDIGQMEGAHAQGLKIYGGMAGRPAGMLYSWQSTIHPFVAYPSYAAIAALPLAEKRVHLRNPAFCTQLLAEQPRDLGPQGNFVTRSFHKLFVLGDPPEYEPDASTSIAAMALQRGCSPAELAYDLMMETGAPRANGQAGEPGAALLYFPIFNYSNNNLDHLVTQMKSPATVLSLGDGGAYCGTFATPRAVPRCHWNSW